MFENKLFYFNLQVERNQAAVEAREVGYSKVSCGKEDIAESPHFKVVKTHLLIDKWVWQLQGNQALTESRTNLTDWILLSFTS